jgi:hypothetical protein
MIGGIIVIGLFITALTAMIVVTQQSDAYQAIANGMKQTDIDQFSENLNFVPPGLAKSGSTVSCGSGQCNVYTMMISDSAINGGLNIGVQIARIYVNSSESPGCTTPCVLTPSPTPAPNTFQASQRYINPGESQHNVTLWLPSSITLPSGGYGLNSISVGTTRGRQFSFNWPIPPKGAAAGFLGGEGGTGLYIGPLVITFQKDLLFYSTQANQVSNVPIGGTNGYWVIPPIAKGNGDGNVILYVKIQTDRGTPNNVYLTAQTVLQLTKFDNPGAPFSFFIVAPISLSYCGLFHNQDPTIVCDPSYGYYAGGNTGDPGNLTGYASCSSTPYSSCPNRYKIPMPTPEQVLNNERGNPVVVAFAASTASGTTAQNGKRGFTAGNFVTSFLGLTYVYNDQSGAGDYTYAVTMPFLAICIDNAPNMCSI